MDPRRARAPFVSQYGGGAASGPVASAAAAPLALPGGVFPQRPELAGQSPQRAARSRP